MKDSKKIGLYAIVIVLVGIIAAMAGYYYADSSHNRDEIAKLQETAYSIEASSDDMNSESEISSDSEPELDQEKQTIDVKTEPFADISSLQDANPDILAWINIPGTNIDYPIAQHPTDDEYYLKHGADGLYSAYGCPYIELCDAEPFLEFNTVIYGHNMKNGSMFAGLHDYEDRDFFDAHREISICTIDHNFSYRVFAAVMYSDARIPYYFDDLIESDRSAFLSSLKEDIVADRSFIADDIEVTEDNCVITLSTCDKMLRDKRFLVVAVLTQIDGQDV